MRSIADGAQDALDMYIQSVCDEVILDALKRTRDDALALVASYQAKASLKQR